LIDWEKRLCVFGWEKRLVRFGRLEARF